MAYIRAGQVVHAPRGFGLHTIVNLFKSVVDIIIFFFRTIFDPKAADEFAAKSSRRGGGGGGGPPKPPAPRGPRILGMGDLRDASGNCAAGA